MSVCPVKERGARVSMPADTHNTMSKRIERASVVQCCTEQYDLQATFDTLERLVEVASMRDGSQLAVFPEAL